MSGNELIGSIHTARNITDRKRKKTMLKKSTERYRTLVENANDSIAIAQNGVIKYATPRATKMFGRSQDELYTSPFVEFVHPDDRGLVLDHHAMRIKGGHPPKVYPFRIIDKKASSPGWKSTRPS